MTNCRRLLALGHGASFVVFLSIGFFAALVGYAAASELERLQWLEHEYLLERGSLASQIADPSLLFVEGRNSAPIPFDRSRLAAIVDGVVQFAAVADPRLVRNLLPAETRGVIDGLQLAGLWNEQLLSLTAMGALESNSARIRQRMRERLSELDKKIEEVRNDVNKLLNPLPLPSETGELAGTWRGCDGREVTFTLEGESYTGRYTALGGLGSLGFKLGDTGYTAREIDLGIYDGEVLWRGSDGWKQWRENRITIQSGTYADTGSDGCSKSMTRVAGP